MRLQLRRSFAAADASEVRKAGRCYLAWIGSSVRSTYDGCWTAARFARGTRKRIVTPLFAFRRYESSWHQSRRRIAMSKGLDVADTLFGSVIATSPSELRVPLLSTFSSSTLPPPIAIFAFHPVSFRVHGLMSLLLCRPWASWCSNVIPLRQQRRSTVVPLSAPTHALPTGGAERQWCYLAVALQRMGRKVILVLTESLKNGSHYLPVLKRAGIEVVEIARLGLSHIAPWLPHDHAYERLFSEQHSPFGIRLLQLSSYLRRENPSAVISQLDSTNLLAGVASLIADVPRIVLSFRNYRPTRFSYLNVPWFKPVYERLVHSQRVMLAGNWVLGNQDYAEWLDIPSARIAHIRNAIHIEDLESDPVSNSQGLRLSLGLRQDQPLLMGVFRLSEEKDPLAFVDVCERVFRTNQDCAAVIVGEGPLKDMIERRVLLLGLEGKLKLLGPLSDVGSLMRGS